eukprot:maker-scaffold588_size129673-snap-gene-0.12 protein:Tk02771 transcript:maker-scaffold588_size129673-snap-gene-0.12-mRNA-1 annotation:"PREDICTED: myophilin-like"
MTRRLAKAEEDREKVTVLEKKLKDMAEKPPPNNLSHFPHLQAQQVMGKVEEGGLSEGAKVAARKASREIRKMKNDTSGGGKRSKEREHTVIKFILMVIHGDKPSNIDFAEWIKDGQVLMNMMTTLSFNSVPSDPYGSAGEKPEETRVRNLVETIHNYGVDKKFLFQVDDLWEGKNIPKVVRCLEEIAELAKDEEHVNFAILPANKIYS